PGDTKYENIRESKNAQHELRRNSETAATTASACPEQVGFRAYCRLQRTPLAINHGHLLKNVARQSMRPGQQTVTATHHMSGNANRRATPSRKRIPFICKFLVNIIERNACAHGDNPCGGIDTDIFQTSKVDHDAL